MISTATEHTRSFEGPLESSTRGRIDGDLKVTGAMRYAADVPIDGVLHAAALRSPHPHARIVSIDTSRARSLPGVHGVLTGADVPGVLYGRSLRDAPLLAVGKVRYIGETVAVVAADTLRQAADALAAIHVEYEPLPAVLDVEEAIRPGAAVVHDDPGAYPGAAHRPEDPPNVIAAVRVSAGPDVEEALAQADQVFEHTFRTARVHQGYIEPSCCTVSFEPSGRVRLWSCNKAPYRLREILGETFDLDPHDVEAFTPAIGGDFGGKGSPGDVPICLELARRTGRTVRLVRDYTAELTAGTPAPGSVTTIRMGVTNDGGILAMDTRTLFDAGAYGGFTPAPAARAVGGTCYRIPSVRIENLRVYTNEVPNGNMRAPSAPQVTFAMEGMMEHVARGLGLDPAELRRRNLLTAGETSFQGHAWPENRGLETLEAAERAATPAFPSNPSPSLRFGRGLAVYDRATEPPQPTSLRLRLLPDGRVEGQVAIAETGTGSHTMLQTVLASELGLPSDRIVLRRVGTGELPIDSGVGGSRVTVSTSQVGVIAAGAFRQELIAQTAPLLEASPEQVELRPGGRLAGPGGQEIALQDVASRGVRVEALGEVAGRSHGGGATSYCVQIAQVGVDVETGQVFLYDFVNAVDVAEILNPMGHRGQIEGGIIMGVGAAMSEDLGLVDGRVTAAHLGDYKLQTIADVPPLRVVLLPGGQGVGARNVKSIGETTNVPAAAAVANAVANALGVCMDELPLTPERVLAAVQMA